MKLTIALPEELKAFAEARAGARGSGDASACVCDLLGHDEARAAEERFAALMQAGLDSPMDPRSWEAYRIVQSCGRAWMRRMRSRPNRCADEEAGAAERACK